jgi:hypothetical protein
MEEVLKRRMLEQQPNLDTANGPTIIEAVHNAAESQLKSDALQRLQFGQVKYQQILKANNGSNPITEARQELSDYYNYLTQAELLFDLLRLENKLLKQELDDIKRRTKAALNNFKNNFGSIYKPLYPQDDDVDLEDLPF